MNGQLVKIVSGALLSLMAGTCGSGCIIPLEGSGAVEIGLENKNVLVIRHTVDGDKVDNKSKAELKIAPFVQTLLGVGGSDEPEEAVVVPATVKP